MEEKLPLTVVVLTKNEEFRIRQCLDSVKWADEIIVVDDLSTDNTINIAKQYTEKIFSRKMEVEGTHRNWAYAQAKNNWVLSLDADELATAELKKEIADTLKKNPLENGFTIPRRNYIGDYWVKYGGWYPSPQLKLFKKDKFRYEEVAVHPRAFMDDPCGHLKSDIIHYTYRNYEDFLRKLNNQTTYEAQKWYNQNKPMRLGRFLWRGYDRFMRSYFGRKGYKDGFIGFVIAFNAGLYQFVSYLKYREIVHLHAKAGLKVVFIDRDGVINAYPGDYKYVTKWEEFHFLPRVELALKKLINSGFKIFIISNQAGVAKGLYSQKTLDNITGNMLNWLNSHQINISGVYYCTHHQNDNCACRKPKTGLIDLAIKELNKSGNKLDLSSSFFIGDSVKDVETGKNAGLKTLLIFSGKEKPENSSQWQVLPDMTAVDLYQAVELILQ